MVTHGTRCRWRAILAGAVLTVTLCGARAENRENEVSVTERPKYGRNDLPELKTRDRAGVFEALGSFEALGLGEADFTDRALDLLDPDRVPGLAAARAAGDRQAALRALWAYAAARVERAAGPVCTPAQRKTADDALENRFTFYGETHGLPAKLDWDFNPGTAHWAHDLNRFSYLPALALAGGATGDARYGKKAAALILDWVAACDFARAFGMQGYAFGSYLNLAIHAPAWARALRRPSVFEALTPFDLLTVLKSLHEHLAYLEIVTAGHAGNWPTIAAAGMLNTLAAFPVFRDTARWTRYVKTMTAEQIAEQVLPDGVQDELTPHYHQVVMKNLFGIIASLRELGEDLDPATLATLKKMTHYRQQTWVPDGTRQAAFNDSDPAMGAWDLRRDLAELGLAAFASPPERLGPEYFPYAGTAFLRQRADRGDLYLAFDAGPYGRAHQHEDKLGFWLFAYGRSFLVDPGRHLYDRTRVSFLDYLKSTRAHSTILVDGQGQNSAARRDTWIAREPLDLGWLEQAGEVRARGAYELGYGPQNAIQVTHRREIVFVRERFWVVFDEVSGAGGHEVESRFQFAPGAVRREGAMAWTVFDDANLLVWALGASAIAEARLEEGLENPRAGWYSDSYNRIEPAPALALTVRGDLPVRLATLLLPYRGAARPAAAFSFDGRTATVRLAGLGEVRIESRLAGRAP